MQDRDQSKIDLTSDVKRANKAIFPIMLLLIAFVYFLYNNVNGTNLFSDLLDAIQSYGSLFLFSLIYLLFLAFLIVFHAYIHAFFLIIIGHIKRENIRVTIENKKLMPYVSHDVPVNVSAYKWSLFLPYLLLGLLPLGYGIAQCNALVVFAGMLISICYMGDIPLVFKLAKVDKDYMAISHPGKYGCFLYKKK